MSRTWLKWMPAVVVPVLIASAAVAVPLSANAAVNLSAKTPQEVLALVAAEKLTALSGTINQTSSLGLPDLPTAGIGSDASASSALELLTGSHTARVYLDGATKERVQVLDRMAERDLIRSGSDVWLYDSKKKTAEHTTLPTRTARTPEAGATALTPGEIAKKLLASVDSTTAVTLGEPILVAGRPAYDLVVTPKAAGTLVGSISIAVDSETGLPLSVEVAARGQKASAFSVGFSQIDLTTPTPPVFSFTPPAGAKVIEKAMPTAAKGHLPAAQQPVAHKPTVIGTGWEAVVSVPSSKSLGSLTSLPLFSKLTTAVAGGHVFHTSLANVLLMDDGRVFAGSVPVSRLQAVAAAK